MKKMLIILFCLLLLTPLAFAEQEFKTMMNNATDYLEKNEFDKAIDLLTKAKNTTDKPETVLQLDFAIGKAFFKKKDYGKAKNYYEQALANATIVGDDEWQVFIRNNLGLIAYTEGDLETAKTVFSPNAAKKDAFAKKYMVLVEEAELKSQELEAIQQGVVLRHEQDFDNAVRLYDKALSINPSSRSALEFKGYALLRLGKPEESLTCSQQAYKIRKTPNTFINIVKAYCRLNDYDTAKDFIRADNATLGCEQRHNILNDFELLKFCPKDVVNTLK